MPIGTIPLGALLFLALAQTPPDGAAADQVVFMPAGRCASSLFDLSAAEIPAFHPASKRLFVVNGAEGLDIIDLADPARAERVAVRRQANATSVAIHGNLVALSALGPSPTSRGIVRFFDPSGKDLGRVTVGFGPDMITFTPDGRRLIVACEGECPPPVAGAAPGSTVDPPGSVAIVELAEGVEKARVIEVGFDGFEPRRAELVGRGLRVVTPGRTIAEDLEPEYVAIAPDGRTAFVTLQENNAVAVIDLGSATVRSIEPLGFRDCTRPGQGIDAVVDGVGAPRPVPVLAMPQPDAIAAFDHGGTTWLLTVNEGESRAGAFDEVITWRQAHAQMHGAEALRRDPEPWGALQVSCVPAPSGAGAMPCAFGTRSISLWRLDPATARLELAWDSGEAIERLVAERTPALFNADHSKGPRVDARSRSKGPEPEGVTIGEVGGCRIAFVTLERSSAVVAFDLTDPARPGVVGFLAGRDATADLDEDRDRDRVPDHWREAGDLGPEGLCFIPAATSPTGEDLLVVCNEVSGSTAIHRVRRR